jgi:type II secretory pathway component PulF
MPFHWPGFDATRRLSADEAAELAARVADLTRAGLPLGDGLRALARELLGRRLGGVLTTLADRLDAGMDLAAAVDSLGSRIPVDLRGLVLAGLRGGHLPEVLEEYVDLERNQSELRHRVAMSLAYPTLLLAMLTVAATLAQTCIARPMASLFHESQTMLPELTSVFLRSSTTMASSFAVLLAAAVLVPILLWASAWVGWVWPVLHGIPILGSMLRYSHAARCARILGLLLEQRTPLPDALRLTAAGLRDARLAGACRRVADDVERGRVLYESMAARPQFPATMIPLVEWGQRVPALPEAFRAAADMLESRARTQKGVFGAVLAPAIFMAVAGYIGAFVVAMMLPLVKFMTMLIP